jgi:hypothetical protein
LAEHAQVKTNLPDDVHFLEHPLENKVLWECSIHLRKTPTTADGVVQDKDVVLNNPESYPNKKTGNFQ